MLYIVSISKGETGAILHYRGFDTYSESSMLLAPERLKAIILHTDIKVVNAKVENNELVLNNWVNEIHTESTELTVIDNKVVDLHHGANFVLLAKRSGKYKLVGFRGNVYTFECIEDTVRAREVANCRLIRDRGLIRVESADAYELQNDAEFEETIEKKYKGFLAKTMLLGHQGITFDFKIENHDVKLTEYTGSNKHVILPPFITSIMKEAFRRKGIETIKFSEGLKSIGAKAFVHGNIARVEIPESVELIGTGAFGNNPKLFKNTGAINDDRFILRNAKTVVMSQEF